MLEASDELINEHYSHIVQFDFFPAIQAFMQETPIIALALEAEDGISRARKLLGPTDSKEAEAGTIRGDLAARMNLPKRGISATPLIVPKPLKPSFNDFSTKEKSSPECSGRLLACSAGNDPRDLRGH